MSTTYGDIALHAWRLAAQEGISPQEAWKAAVREHYADPSMRKNALKHTCPKGAFLGLCERGLLPGIPQGNYTRSVKSRSFALKAVELLRADHTLAGKKAELEGQVFGNRTPNDEVAVVLSLWDVIDRGPLVG